MINYNKKTPDQPFKLTLLRSYYIHDYDTPEWPIYFYPKLNDKDEIKWVMDIDEEFKYDFDVPFVDDDWKIQKYIDDNWVNIL
jgi:hypothetical protein